MAATPQETTTTPERPSRTAAPAYDASAEPAATERGGRPGRAVAALVLGIISIPAALVPIAAWVLGVLAIVLGATARSDIRRRNLGGHGQATAGMICGAIGVVLGLANFIVALSAAT